MRGGGIGVPGAAIHDVLTRVRVMAGPYAGHAGVVERRDAGHPGCAKVRLVGPWPTWVWLEDCRLEAVPDGARSTEMGLEYDASTSRGRADTLLLDAYGALSLADRQVVSALIEGGIPARLAIRMVTGEVTTDASDRGDADA